MCTCPFAAPPSRDASPRYTCPAPLRQGRLHHRTDGSDVGRLPALAPRCRGSRFGTGRLGRREPEKAPA
eukprot:scaffold25664_cov119-Isochrysis_galbana.AAC.2